MNPLEELSLRKNFIGLSYEDGCDLAKKLDKEVRISKKDGRYYTLTRDYKPNRINFQLENNVIANISIG